MASFGDGLLDSLPGPVYFSTIPVLGQVESYEPFWCHQHQGETDNFHHDSESAFLGVC